MELNKGNVSSCVCVCVILSQGKMSTKLKFSSVCSKTFPLHDLFFECIILLRFKTLPQWHTYKLWKHSLLLKTLFFLVKLMNWKEFGLLRDNTLLGCKHFYALCIIRNVIYKYINYIFIYLLIGVAQFVCKKTARKLDKYQWN